MDSEKRIDSLKKDREILVKNLRGVENQISGLNNQRNEILQELIKIGGMIKERQLDLKEKKVRKEKGKNIKRGS